MAQLIVRGLETEVVDRLKVRAARKGHSAEEEHRRILRDALAGEAGPPLAQLLLEMPGVGEDGDFDRPDELPRPVEL